MMNPDDLFRRLTFGETYARALEIFYHKATFFLAVGGIMFVPYVAFMIHYMHFLGDLVETAAAQQQQQQDNPHGNNGNDDDTDEWLVEALAHGELARMVAELALYSFCGILGGCTMARGVAQIYVGEENVSIAKCGKYAFGRFCNIFAASWMVGLGVIVAYVVTVSAAVGLVATHNVLCGLLAASLIIAFVVAFIYIQVAMMLATPVVMVENKGPIRTIQRCWELAHNNRCYIYCTLFCMIFVLMVVMGMVGGVVFAKDPMARFSTWGAILQTLPYIVILPLATM